MATKPRQYISPFQYNPGNDSSVVTYLQGLKGGDAPGRFLLVGANNSPGPTPVGLVYQPDGNNGLTPLSYVTQPI